MKVDEKMTNFLVASYFGEVTEANLYEICIWRAYLDLSWNVPYKYSVYTLELMKKSKEENDKKEADEFEKCKQEFKKQIYNCIMQAFEQKKKPIDIIHSIFDEANKYGQKNDMWKDNESFYFGLAQKWINMTLKYLWLFGKLPEYIEEKELDVPIDSYIIYAAMSDNDEYGLNIKVKGLRYETSWSRMDEKLYGDVQKEIREKIGNKPFKTGIEWEQIAWIKQAKYEA